MREILRPHTTIILSSRMETKRFRYTHQLVLRKKREKPVGRPEEIAQSATVN